MKALVTGGSGFIGGNLVRELVKQGFPVRAFVRKESVLRNLEGLRVEIVQGDLRDRASLEKAIEGCDILFHLAAAYTFWCSEPAIIYETNVQGTRNVLDVAMRQGVKRVVYTSTESTIGILQNGCLGNELMGVDDAGLAGDYKKSKYLAEKVALDMCRQGLPVVVVNPTMPVGPLDCKPTPTGKLITDFLNHRMPAYVDTGLNVVDVEDVARGHILAWEKGRIGERYILGNENLTLKEILAILERLTSIKAPRLKLPLWFTLGMAHVDELLSAKVLGKSPRIPVAAVKTACNIRHFDCSKAIRELGFPQTPVEQAFEKAVRWFRANGYAS